MLWFGVLKQLLHSFSCLRQQDVGWVCWGRSPPWQDITAVPIVQHLHVKFASKVVDKAFVRSFRGGDGRVCLDVSPCPTYCCNHLSPCCLGGGVEDQAALPRGCRNHVKQCCKCCIHTNVGPNGGCPGGFVPLPDVFFVPGVQTMIGEEEPAAGVPFQWFLPGLIFGYNVLPGLVVTGRGSRSVGAIGRWGDMWRQ